MFTCSLNKQKNTTRYYNSPQTPMLIKIPVKLTYIPPDFTLLPKVKTSSNEVL